MTEQQRRALAETLTELLLTLLPVITLFFVLLFDHRLKSMVYHEEWLFIATVLYAQSIVKLRKTDRSQIRLRHEWIDLLSIILFVLLIPSTLLLGYMSWTNDRSHMVGIGLVTSVLLSLISFVFTSLFASRVLDPT